MKQLIFFVFFTILIKYNLFCQEVPSFYKKPIIYVLVKNKQGDFVPSGTAFFLGIVEPKDTTRVFGYLVTDKHVLFNGTNQIISNQIEVRINTKNGLSQTVKINLFERGLMRNVYTHSDPTVDLVVIPLVLDEIKYDYERYPVEMLFKNRNDFLASYVKEGTNVFYTGMFTPYQGYKKISPIMRFGKVAMIPEEKVQWEKDTDLAELFFVETTTFGGNSGSPLFSLSSNSQFDGSLTVGNSSPKLIGIIKGYYGEKSSIEIVNTSNNLPMYTSNIGITGVIPSYLLYEILYSYSLSTLRSITLQSLK